jgi:hypothetical protein
VFEIVPGLAREQAGEKLLASPMRGRHIPGGNA